MLMENGYPPRSFNVSKQNFAPILASSNKRQRLYDKFYQVTVRAKCTKSTFLLISYQGGY